MLTKIRLSFSILLFLISLLVLVEAPSNLLWKISIIATEFSILFIILCLFPLISLWWKTKTSLLSAGFCLASLIIFLSPIYKANVIASELPTKIDIVFGEKEPSSKLMKDPFSFKKLLLSFPLKKSEKKKFTTWMYENTPASNLTLDFYESVVDNAPCVIIVHGGAWCSGDSRELPQLNSYLASNGYAVASVNYRLAPEHHFPAPLEDIESAIRFLKHKATELKIDTANFVLLGRSAGGQLALMAAYTLKDPGIKGVISFYAPADMVWANFVKCSPLVLDSEKTLSDYIGSTYKEAPEKFERSSPIEFVSANSPPTLIIHGELDVMVAYEHSRRLAEKLSQKNVKHLLVTLPWATHGCDYNFYGPSGQISTFAVRRLLDMVTTKKEIVKPPFR